MAKKNVILVGGLLEYRAFKMRFPGSIVLIMRGANALDPAKGLANRVKETIRPRVSSARKIVVVLDREVSQSSSDSLQQIIERALGKAVSELPCSVVCPDRMIENWILADINAIKCKKYISRSAKQKSYEGCHGKNELKKIIAGATYRETQHGIELLLLVRDSVASKNSPSFKAFLSAAG